MSPSRLALQPSPAAQAEGLSAARDARAAASVRRSARGITMGRNLPAGGGGTMPAARGAPPNYDDACEDDAAAVDAGLTFVSCSVAGSFGSHVVILAHAGLPVASRNSTALPHHHSPSISMP